MENKETNDSLNNLPPVNPGQPNPPIQQPVQQQVQQPVQEIPTQINPDDIKPVEGGSGVDLKKYDKSKVTIERIEIVAVNSNYTPRIEGTDVHQKQWVLKVLSQVLETYEKDDEVNEFRCSELFNLVQDNKGNLIGFPTGEGSNLMKFCLDLGIENPDKFENLSGLIREIKGKKALVKAYDKVKDGKTRTYLKFRY